MNSLPPIILASASLRRRELLRALNLPFTVVVSDVDEDAVDPTLDPQAMVRLLARQKAEAVARQVRSGLVIGADTTVVLGELALGKPTDPDDARAMLRRLRGKLHHVISGVAVIDVASGQIGVGTAITAVLMRDYTDAQIDAYVASGEPMDKAGSYAIQGLGGALVAEIDGCYNNVIGLPLCEVAALLARCGVVLPVTGPVCLLPDGAPCPRLIAPSPRSELRG